MFIFVSKLLKMIENIVLEIAQLSDINGILNLQEQYLVTNLSDEEKKSGFVTTPFSVAQLSQIIGQEGLFVAKYNQKIIAYIFAGNWDFFSQWPIFNHMTTLFPKLEFRDFEITTHNSFQYGPICIDKKYRGQGLINRFFEFMRMHVLKKYPLSITFINKTNIPSQKAHTEKLSWTIIGEFEFNANNYYILGYDMSEAVFTK
jgi:hypothetical protein